MSIDAYNQSCIGGINAKVNDEDTIIFFGELSKGSVDDTKEIFNKIKGKKTLVDRIDNLDFPNNEDLKQLGFNHLWSIGGYLSGEFDNKFYEAYIVPLKYDMDLALKQRDSGFYIVTTTSKLPKDLIVIPYNDKILNVDFKLWSFNPLSYSDIIEQISAYGGISNNG